MPLQKHKKEPLTQGVTQENTQESLEKLFQEHAWQPFTQMKLLSSPIFIERGEGVYLFDIHGKALLDAVGSWWVNIHGHNHPRINAAIKNQLEKVEHLIYAGLAHSPALELAQKLSAASNHRLKRVFYSDNGSTAVEIALKMAYQYFWNQGETSRQEFISLGGGYHGDTFGAMSVGADSHFHKAFRGLLFPCRKLPAPVCPFDSFYDEDKALMHLRPVVEELERLFAKRAKKICALILEPIIQGASAGFAFYPPILLKRIHEMCRSERVFLIADEVFTGCGRTGFFYACQRAGIWPDLMTLSKGLSGGYLPFAATLASEDIYQAFYSDDRSRALFHGHSMTANPLGCAAALASLSLLEDGALKASLDLESLHKEFQNKIMQGPLQKKIKECRTLGSVGVIELKIDTAYTSNFGWRIMQKCIEAGVLLRPLGNVIYFVPPYCITAEELGRAYAVMENAVRKELGV